jgi:RNA polymerase primary sigma factor
MENKMKSIKSGDYTLEEIAKILGITRERVRQIETQALKKLKSPNIGRKLKDYISGEL